MSFAQPDITLLLDTEGVIREATLSNALPDERVQSWLGRAWIDTVADAGSDKITRMVEDALTAGVSGFRQVTQRFPSGLELPIEYTTVRLGGKAGLIAVGKNLQAVSELQSRLIAAQHAMEQDYWKLREVETRYRLLFDASNEAVLLLRAEDLRIVEANPAAIRGLGLARGWEFLGELAAHERDTFRAMLGRVRDQGKAPGIVIHLGPDRIPWLVRASLMNGGPGAVYLVQLAMAGVGAVNPQNNAMTLDGLIEDLPDGFVVVDADGVIQRANRAFLDLVQLGAEGAVLGKTLDEWMPLPGADAKVLLANLRRNGAVRLFMTTLQGQLGLRCDVEVSAGGDLMQAPGYAGILLRDVSRRLSQGEADQSGLVLRSIAEHSGKLSLRELVQEAVSLVERHYVESALDLSDGNRTAAAELLGVSRQSLYAKLDRYGFEGWAPAASEGGG